MRKKISISIRLDGSIPSKKNRYRRSNNGRMYIPSGVRAQLDALLWQLKKYKPSKPITCPVRIDMSIYTRTMRQDKNNISQTIADLLQESGIIKNDRQDVDGRVTRARGTEDIAFVDVSTI